ncbi:MAG: hypothetical protein ABW352_17730 [Polyangiales bacterium]
MLGYDPAAERERDGSPPVIIEEHDAALPSEDARVRDADLDAHVTEAATDARMRDAELLDALVEVDARMVEPPDAGDRTADASGLDAAQRDAGTDASKGPVELACAPGQTCSPSCPYGACNVDCHDAASCTATCNAVGPCNVDCSGAAKCGVDCTWGTLSCNVDCSDATTCDVRCRSGTVCTSDCTDAHCSIRCEYGAKCDVSCESGAACSNVVCMAGSTCSARCPDPSNCPIQCSGSLATCSNGLVVCNRSCS